MVVNSRQIYVGSYTLLEGEKNNKKNWQMFWIDAQSEITYTYLLLTYLTISDYIGPIYRESRKVPKTIEITSKGLRKQPEKAKEGTI